MSPVKRDYILYLSDMFLSMQRINKYIREIDFETFSQSDIVLDAVIRNLEIIGEAAKKIPFEVQEKYPEMPWSKMYSLRNLIAHEYFAVDIELVWELAKNRLPQNCSDLERIIKSETT